MTIYSMNEHGELYIKKKKIVDRNPLVLNYYYGSLRNGHYYD